MKVVRGGGDRKRHLALHFVINVFTVLTTFQELSNDAHAVLYITVQFLRVRQIQL